MEEHRLTLLDWLHQSMPPARRETGEWGLWQPGFRPEVLYTQAVFEQKLRYVHLNPVRKGLVTQPEDWYYSSARCGQRRDDVCLEVEPLWL